MVKPWVVGAGCFILGATAASGAWTAFPPRPTVTKEPKPAPSADAADDGALQRANDNLTASLHECDRRLAELGERPVAPAAVAAAEPPPAERDAGGRSRRRGGEITKEDWERMAEMGVVRTRVPCIRDTAWAPSARTVDRLGLAPQDTDAIKAAYEASNKRMNDQIRPLCARVLGSEAAAEKVGASACVDVINSSARKTNADDTKAALSRVAEVQAGKRDAPKSTSDLPPVEQLAYLLTNEAGTFEKDLAQKLGPEEAKRLANAPEMCADRHMLRGADFEPREGREGRDGREGRGRR